jgi:hypothetical protein
VGGRVRRRRARRLDGRSRAARLALTEA